MEAIHISSSHLPALLKSVKCVTVAALLDAQVISPEKMIDKLPLLTTQIRPGGISRPKHKMLPVFQLLPKVSFPQIDIVIPPANTGTVLGTIGALQLLAVHG